MIPILKKHWFTWSIRLALAVCVATAHAGPSLVQCNGIKDLVFVAHQDDDLLFMNPDIESTIDAGGCVQVVYLTASERGEGEGYMLGRERGVRAAYSYMAQEPNIWAEDFATVGARHLARFILHGNQRLQLLHMRLKDPWLGKGWGSLTPLSSVESIAGTTAQSLGPAVETYSRPELVATIRQLIQEFQPSTIRHMDASITIPYADLCWRCAGHDHPDHIASARLVHDAIVSQPGNYAEVAYLDYPSQERATNLSTTEISEKTQAFRRYAWDDYRYCVDAKLCQEPAGPAAAWVGRAYYASSHYQAPQILANPEGGFSLFAVGETNAAANVWQGPARQWASLGGRTPDRIVAFNTDDGRIGVFARDATGLAWVSKQTPEGSWKSWQLVRGGRLTSLPVVTAHGPLMAVAMGNNGLLHYSRPVSGTNQWTPWHALPTLPGALPDIAVVSDSTGATLVFAADTAGRVWHSAYMTAWSPWQALDAPATSGGLAAIQNANNLIELYLRDKANGHMLRIVRSAAGSTGVWSTPSDLGVGYAGSPAVGLNEKGAVAVAALDQLGAAIWLIEGGQATQLTTSAGSPPALRTIHNVMYVVARSTDKPQTYWVRARRHDSWSEPLLLAPPPDSGGGAFDPGLSPDANPIKPLRTWYTNSGQAPLVMNTDLAAYAPHNAP